MSGNTLAQLAGIEVERIKGLSGKRGEKLRGRVTLLVHRGDVESGRVAERLAEL